MLRVLVHDALAAALLHGFKRISFHGYCIEARRFSAAGAERASVDLTLTAFGGAELLDRVRIAVAFRSDRCTLRIALRSRERQNRSDLLRTGGRKARRFRQCFYPAGESHPRTGDGLSIFMCSMS